MSHVLTTLATTEQRQLPWERVSKKVENHGAAIALYFMYYNFGRIHQTLRVTPAMEAGVANHVWSVEKIVGLLG